MRLGTRLALGYVAVPLIVAAPVFGVVLLLGQEAAACLPADGGRVEDAAISPQHAAMVNDAATAHGISAPWLAAVIAAESNWNPRALSPAGAMGLAQLMPGTARRLGVTDPWDPQQSINGGAAYLAEMFEAFGSWELAVAAYNAGPGAVRRYGGIPPFPETQAYVPKVGALAEHFGATDHAAVVVCTAAIGVGPTIVGGVACPVGQPHQFSDTWGAPRSGGRSHEGVDIFADHGIPLYAYQAGTVRLSSSPLGGISLWITSDSGDEYYYAHLSGYAPGLRTGSRVEVGQVIGFNGNSGNARYTPPHLHWQVHPGGGAPVNPTPLADVACGRAGR